MDYNIAQTRELFRDYNFPRRMFNSGGEVALLIPDAIPVVGPQPAQPAVPGRRATRGVRAVRAIPATPATPGTNYSVKSYGFGELRALLHFREYFRNLNPTDQTIYCVNLPERVSREDRSILFGETGIDGRRPIFQRALEGFRTDGLVLTEDVQSSGQRDPLQIIVSKGPKYDETRVLSIKEEPHRKRFWFF